MSDAKHLNYRFPRLHRLTRSADIRRVLSRGIRTTDRFVIMYAMPNGLGITRLGLSVGRRVGPAVVRNHCKRLLREAFRLQRLGLSRPGFDMVCIPRNAAEAGLDVYRRSLAALLDKAVGKLQRVERVE